jgi:hypothetical protein
MSHEYTATACLHDRHDDCRFFCKWCPAPCLCACHGDNEQPYPGYSASVERQLRQDLRQEIARRDITPGPRQAELLVDIVTAVLVNIEKHENLGSDEAHTHGS